MRSYHEIRQTTRYVFSKFHLEDAIQSRNVRSWKPRNLGKVRNCNFSISLLTSPRKRRRSPNTLAGTDLLCMLNWGTQWTMVSYLKK